MEKVELLAPAGDLEKLKIAIDYGADAVYFGGEQFSLRTASGNFSQDDIIEGIAYAHKRNKKCYAAVNIIPRNDEIDEMVPYLKMLKQAGADALIISDFGVFCFAKEYTNLPIHISTQANNVNYRSVIAWSKMGASRVILARELSLDEIRRICKEAPKGFSLEVFVHGAMCMSYSGRCLLSNYMAHRDANRGSCAHPCRWNYYLMEEKRPGEYFPVTEDKHGAFIFNSKDLCMIEHLPELISTGVTSLKIEGRVKSAYYVATVVNAYRMAIDAYYENPKDYKVDPKLVEEVCKVSHRDYYTGFYFGNQQEKGQIYPTSSYIRNWDVVGMVDGKDLNGELALCTQKNRFFKGDTLELLSAGHTGVSFVVGELYDGEGNPIEAAPHPEMKLKIPIPVPFKKGDILRKEKT